MYARCNARPDSSTSLHATFFIRLWTTRPSLQPNASNSICMLAWLSMLVDWAFLSWKGLTTSITTQISTHHYEMLFWIVFHAIPGGCCVSFPWGRGRATASSLFVFAFVDVNFTFSRNWSSCRTTKSCPSGYGNLNRVNICIVLIFLVRHFSL